MFRIALVILALSWTSTDAKCQNFNCNSENNKLVYLTELQATFECSDGMVCNRFGSANCEPCIKKSDNCYERFECSANDLSEVIINGNTYRCKAGEECNANYDEPCDACISKTCDKSKYTCMSSNLVSINNVLVQCIHGYFCNSNYNYPCQPCIDTRGRIGTYLSVD